MDIICKAIILTLYLCYGLLAFALFKTGSLSKSIFNSH